MPRAATRSLLAKRFDFTARCSCCANRFDGAPGGYIDGDRKRPLCVPCADAAREGRSWLSAARVPALQ